MSTAEYEKMFTEVDKDGNGYLSEKEVADLLNEGGYRMSEEELKVAFRSFDDNADGKVTKDEFVSTMQAFEDDVHNTAQIRKLFNMYDANRDGTIDRKELKKVMEVLGEKLTDEQIAKFIAECDTDQSGTVNYEEFLAALTS